MKTPLFALLYLLNSLHVRYLLLTDFECELTSKDVDLFVPHESRNLFESTLQNLGWRKRKEPAYHKNHHFYYAPDTRIYLDVKYELTFAGSKDKCFTYLTGENALDNAILNSKGVYRPYGIDAILFYAAHLGFRERGKLEEKHRTHLLGYLTMYRSELTGSAAKVVADLKGWLQTSNLHQTDELQTILLPYFRSTHQSLKRSRRYLKYGYGATVLFLGTDGAGKTTLINAVESKLQLKVKKLYLGLGESGWSTNVTKHIYRQKTSNKLLEKPFNFFKYFMVLPLEFLLRILPVKFRSKYSIVLIDRLPGYVFKEGQQAKRLLYNIFMPKPDLVFFLYASPEVLLKRKPQENTLSHLQENMLKLQQMAEIVSAGKYVDVDTTDISVEEAMDFIISTISNHPKVTDNLLTSNFN